MTTPWVPPLGHAVSVETGELIAFSDYSATYRDYERFAQEGSITQVDVLGTNYVLFALPDEPEEQLRETARLVFQRFEAVQSALKRRAMHQAVPIATVPPALFLCLGLGIAWVARGFRK